MRDAELMGRALELARNSLYVSDPNPRVGCVIARDGVVVAEGWTQRSGDDHAEIHALKRLAGGADGADVFLTLEPCSHHGRTGPCVEALLEARVGRVVVAMTDPNPLVAGGGVARLRESGVAVEVGLCGARAASLNPGFLRRVRGGRPWVRVKVAASLDGRTATGGGESRWITGAEARADVHRWRARSSAVVTGIGSVLADDPSMNARVAGDVAQPLRVVLDSGLRTPADAAIFEPEGEVLVVTTEAARAARAPGARRAEVRRCGAGPRVDLRELLKLLARLECNEVLVEAGATLAGAFAAADLVDEYVVYLAPTLIGAAGAAMFELGASPPLRDCPALVVDEVATLGRDVRVLARPRGAGLREGLVF